MMRITLCSNAEAIALIALVSFFPQNATAGPLHPLCLDPFAEQSSNSTLTSLDLRACQKRYSQQKIDQKKLWSASFSVADRVPNGFFTLQDSPEPDPELEDLPSFAGYNIIGQLENEQILVNYVVNYGGSGTFTFGFLLKGMGLDDFINLDETLATKKRSTNLQLINRFEGGDRCFGGITHMSIESPDKISITRNLTPYDLVNLYIPKDQQAKSQGDLPDCALCCIGEYTEIAQNNGYTELREVRLNGARLGLNNAQSKQQECLAGVVDVPAHSIVLNRKELQDLQQAYGAQCSKALKSSEP